MTDKALKDSLRGQYTEALSEFIGNKFDTDVCQIAAGTFMIPAVDAEGNERWVKFSVIIPNASEEEGTDGYSLEAEYKVKLEAAAERKAKAKAKADAALAKKAAKATSKSAQETDAE